MYKHHEFDLHVDYEFTYYDNDGSANIIVTYPSKLHGSVSVTYSGEYEGEASSEACADIVGYMEDPDEWVSGYINDRSSDDKRKLVEAKDALAHYEKDLREYLGHVARWQGYVATKRETIAALQAKIASEESEE